MIQPHILIAVLGAVFSIPPFLGIFWVGYFILRLPLRRQERAGFFLDLLETGMQTGRSAETSIITFSESQDRSMGVRFHLLAAYLETGLRLGQALDKVPHLLPPRIEAMLKTGEEVGDLKKVLPLCRRMLRDGVSQTQGAINYLILLAFVFTPLFPVPLVILRVYILPKWRDVFAGLSTTPLPPLTEFIFGESFWFVRIQLLIAAILYAGALLYIVGPRLSVWMKNTLSISLLDEIAFRIPWKLKRMQRDFSAMLALLLDAGVPEPRAIQLAADSTANAVFIRRAARVVTELASGKKLSDAIERFDETGEFRWRLDNGSKGQAGFTAALSGWLEALDAKAYQQEQSTAQVLTTGLVLLNGVMVGLVVTGIFQALVWMINDAVLW
ncbi:MAG: Type secretory pathway component PulF-like protein [Verrucomicrobiales bacterium]|nr:Type secretory pathway component PulF-like protein [Verrucomicrobiales bacterium]